MALFTMFYTICNPINQKFKANESVMEKKLALSTGKPSHLLCGLEFFINIITLLRMLELGHKHWELSLEDTIIEMKAKQELRDVGVGVGAAAVPQNLTGVDIQRMVRRWQNAIVLSSSSSMDQINDYCTKSLLATQPNLCQKLASK